jgi:hypothetical protein
MISVISYPDRGEGGDPRFWGNCSPRVVEDLLDQFHPRLVYDPAVGSGTTEDVLRRRDVAGWCSDLVRGHDVLRDEPPFVGFDLAFFHPPYWNMVTYTGREGVWKCDPHPDDLSRAPTYEAFLAKLNEANYRIFETLRRGGRMALLVGDLRRRGRLYPIFHDVRWYGEPEAVVIKMQHKTRSGRKSYGSARFVAIVHEYLVVWRKPDAFVVPIRVGQVREADLRNFPGMTWQAVVYGALEQIGGEGDLAEIYEAVRPHARTREARDWQAVVRRELQERPHFAPVCRGRWRLVEPVH